MQSTITFKEIPFVELQYWYTLESLPVLATGTNYMERDTTAVYRQTSFTHLVEYREQANGVKFLVDLDPALSEYLLFSNTPIETNADNILTVQRVDVPQHLTLADKEKLIMYTE